MSFPLSTIPAEREILLEPLFSSGHLRGRGMQRTVEDIIRDHYTVLRQQYHPGYSPNDRSSGADWDKAGATVKRIGADPSMYVDAQFAARNTNPRQSFPWPSQLHGRSAEANYFDYIQKNKPSYENMIVAQNVLLAAQMDTLSMGGMDRALANSNLSFKSWFRILMCSEANLPLFKKVWGNCCRDQMNKDRSLADYLRKKYAERADRLF